MSSPWTPGRRGSKRGAARGRCGFTLIETVVALTILALTAIVLAEAFSAGMRAQARVGENLEAIGLAEAKLDELSLMPADSLAGYRTIREAPFPPPFDEYRWRAVARPVDGEPALIGVGVMVRWRGGEYDLETMLYRPGADPGRLSWRGR